MNNKIIVAICEGAHDIAFISRILLANGYANYDSKISEFLAPFNKKFINCIGRIKIDDKKLGYQNPSYELPSIAYKKDNTYVFIHNLSGDGAIKERTDLVNSYLKIIKTGDDVDDFSQYNFEYRFVYFFDADDLGVNARLEKVKEEISLDNNMTNGEIYNSNGIEYAAYIFHDPGNEKGTLENTLRSLISINNKTEISAADEFIKTHKLPEDRCKEFRCVNGVESYKGKSKFKHEKSILNIIGQLQFSGMNNAVFIKNTDFINTNILNTLPECKKISELFSV